MRSELEQIPGVGPNMAAHLAGLGYRRISDLQGADPEELYRRDCILQGTKVDRCCLYVYRLAVAWAEGRVTTPEQSKWWNWTDREGGDSDGIPAAGR